MRRSYGPSSLFRALFVFLICVLWALTSHAQAVDLTPDEQAYLDALGEITMCVDPDWEPYELMDDQGNFTGIAADLVDIVSERLNIPFVIVPTLDWPETLEVSRAGGCMLIPFLNQTPAREEWLTFTEPLFTNPNVFITRNEHDYISDPAELVDRTVALPHGTSMEEHLRRDFPNLNIITVEDENEVYRKVSEGEADMTLRSLTIAAFTIRRDGWFNLKIAGQPPQDHYMNRLRMGVLKDMPELRDILDTAILTITPRERERIVNEHVNIVLETPFDYALLYRIAGAVGLAILLILAWNYRLKQLNEERRILLDYIQTQVWYMADEQNYGAVNVAHARFLGRPVDDVAYKNIQSLLPREAADTARNSNRQVFESGQAVLCEEWMTDAAGEPRLFSIQKSPKLRKDGSVEYIVCSAEDITERRRAEQELVQAKEAAEAAAQARSLLLDNSGQGFLSFAGDLIVHPEFSRECARIFGRPIGGESVALLLAPDDVEERTALERNFRLALAAEDDLKRNLYLSLLRKEYRLGGLYLEAGYRIVGATMLLILTDVTRRKELESAVMIERNRLKFVVAAVRDAQDFFGLLDDFESFLSAELPMLRSELGDDPESISRVHADLFRGLHTFKGLFAQYDFPGMPGMLHEAENRLSDLPRTAPDPTGHAEAHVDAADLRAFLDAFDGKTMLQSDLVVIEEFLGRSFLDRRGEIVLSRERVADLTSRAEELARVADPAARAEDIRALLEDIRTLRYRDFRSMLVPYSRYAVELAGRQGKHLESFQVEGEAVQVDPDASAPLAKSLIHVFRNAVDHGLESSDERLNQGKPEAGAITCTVTAAGDTLRVTIHDDGRGLDPDRIREAAIRRGLLPPSGAKQVTDSASDGVSGEISDEALFQIILEPGMSTRREVDDLSGRGVGLYAVKAEAERLGGTARVASEPGRGTTIVCEVPLSRLARGAG